MTQKTVLSMFQHVVDTSPTAIALRWKDHNVTYGELRRQIARIQAALADAHVGRDSVVAVLTENPLLAIPAIIATLDGPGIVLPLDPRWPSARVAACLTETGTSIVICGHDSTRPTLPQPVHTITCEAEGASNELTVQIDGQEISDGRSAHDAKPPEAPAYIFMTSGSTGAAKAILGTLKGIDHFIDWEISTLSLNSSVRVSQLTSVAFDAVLRDIFVPLCCGGTLCIPDSRQAITEPNYLARWIDSNDLSLVHCVPSLFRLLLQDITDGPAFSRLQYILLAGERVHPADVARWSDVFGDRVQLINMYGPSETTMTKFAYFIRSSDARRRSIPIGRPIDGAAAYLLNAGGAPCGEGEVGELHIATPYATLGYLGRPDLTAAAFVDPPRSVDVPRDAKVYRTGDLARIVDGGIFEFVGRADDQVKIRGARVECGEIEALLRGHPDVADVAVCSRNDQSGEASLCAYVVATHANVAADAIRHWVARQLPDYMVPTVITLDTLPRLSTGKIDRKALPNPFETSRASRQMSAVTTATELRLTAIWARVLGVPDLGIDDEYFAVGGNSLLAARLIAEVNAGFGTTLPLRSLLDAQTVRRLAAMIDAGLGPSVASAPLPIIAPDPSRRYEKFPLTNVQQAYWVGRSGGVELGAVATHTYFEIEMPDLDVERFRAAWQRIIDRHDMLRAVVLPDGHQQILRDCPPFPLHVRDLREAPAEAIEREIEGMRRLMSHQILPADTGPLFDIRLTILPGGTTRIHVSYDLLISDAFSNGILVREFSALYDQPAATLPPLTLTFRDYVLGDAALRTTAVHAAARQYWESRMGTLPGAPELPLAREPGSLTSQRFKHRIHRLEKPVWDTLTSKAGRVGITPSGLLLAAMAEVLSTWSAQPHYCINVTLFNRLPLHPEVNQIVGDFTSITLLEVDHRQPAPFAQRARNLQRQLWHDLDNRYFSGIEVIRSKARSTGGPQRALYPVVFTSTLMHGTLHGSGMLHEKAQPVFRSSQTSQVWLDQVAVEEEGAAVLRWNAVDDLFPSGMLEAMFDAYCDLLGRLAEGDEAWNEETDLLPVQQRALLTAMNDTAAPVPDGLLHEAVIAQAKKTPDAAAVISSSRILTYSELHARACALGRRLRQDGLEPNQLVAVVMRKGWEQVVGVLGTLIGGGAYLPIDPDLPTDRLHYMLRNGGVRFVLTQSTLLDELAWPPDVTRISVDSAPMPTLPIEPVSSAQSPTDLAYVMYTSGSTGTPKGAMIPHVAVMNRIADVNARFGIATQDRTLALTALHHDLSVYDIFGLLSAGGAMVVPDAARLRDPEHWAELMRLHHVTCWNSVPAFMEMLVDTLDAHPHAHRLRPSSLRWVFLSGDWIPTSLPARIRDRCAGAAVVSLGGPTETTIWDICYPIPPQDVVTRSVPYGRPMTNQRYYVLDDAFQQKPVWVRGELYAGGIGVGKGYWHDDVQTASKFVVHPRTGERLYRTGDLGRVLPDGQIEILGRADFQIKIQGWRIELGEIEANLLAESGVRVAAVAAVESGSGKRLAAFVVPQPVEPDTSMSTIERLRFKLSKVSLRRSDGRSSVPLEHTPMDCDTFDQYVRRRSYRSYAKGAVSKADFSALLAPLSQASIPGYPVPKYRYASAGGLYPIQTYVYVKEGRLEGVEGGAYYYNPESHQLVMLSQGSIAPESYHAVNREVFKESAFSLFFVAQMDAITPVYGETAWPFCLIEAGMMAHLLESEAPSHSIGLCQIGGVDFDTFADLFKLTPSHRYVFSTVGGGLAPEQIGREGLIADASTLIAAIDSLHDGSRGSAVDEQAWRVQRDHDVLVDTLRRRLAAALPEYMVPSSIQVVDHLPLSPNGKVDRRALASLATMEKRDVEQAAPASDVEREIALIWTSVLGVPDVGVTDNFFDLGGHSVHVIRVHGQLQQKFSTQVPLIELFRCPTVRDLARLVSGRTTDRRSLNVLSERASRQLDAEASLP